jgi:hypothetical protein
MPGIKCPICGKTGHSFWEGFLRPTYSSLRCPSCNKRLELVNAGRCHFISGIISAAILVFIFFMQLPFLWVWVILLGFLCWFLDVLIVWLLGRWRVWSYELSELVKLRWLSAANTISTIIVGVWVFYMAWTLLLPYWKMIGNFDLMDDQIDEMVEHYKELFSVQGIIGIIIGIVSIMTSGTTGLIKGRLRRRAVEKSLSQTIQD